LNVALLIDAIVRQTMIMVAQLATAAGMRAPLAHVANKVFLDLVAELQSQGVGQKVIADMFGMALRTYHAKVRRLSESATDRGSTLWEAVLSHIQESGLVRRGDILLRFSRDDVMTVKGVLNDLVETGLVFKAGRGEATAYRAATSEEQGFGFAADPIKKDAHIVWVALHHLEKAQPAEISAAIGIDEEPLERVLQLLLDDGRITMVHEEGEVFYTCETCVIPVGDAVGWEAAVFDHYQAMVVAICTKLNRGETRSELREAIGGCTYGFDIWEGHPMAEEVLGFLARTREQGSELRQRVDAHNGQNTPPPDPMRVIFYAGQTVKTHDSREDD
jgi:hypothetical protein